MCRRSAYDAVLTSSCPSGRSGRMMPFRPFLLACLACVAGSSVAQSQEYTGPMLVPVIVEEGDTIPIYMLGDVRIEAVMTARMRRQAERLDRLTRNVVKV